jgi:uncharacterized OB-fold protein
MTARNAVDATLPSDRPRPAATPDTRWWWDAINEHRLQIQRCDGCERLRHPPTPSCPSCRSLEWSPIEASGQGEVYSYTVLHHPQLPGFDYPLAAAVIQLEEGARLVSNVVGVPAAEVRIGQPVQVEYLDAGDGISLPQFRVIPTSAQEADGGA